MPDVTTVYRWLEDEAHALFRNLYARAKADQLQLMAEDILAIADDKTDDTAEVTVTKKNGDQETYTQPNHAAVQRARLQVDTRKWLLAKLVPRKFGDAPPADTDDKIIVEGGLPPQPRDDGKTDGA